MKWRPSSSVTLPASGFIEPCIPSPLKRAPTSADCSDVPTLDGCELSGMLAELVDFYTRPARQLSLRLA